MTGLHLRDYQLQALQAIDDADERGVRRPLLALPTGSGKTVIFAELIRRRGGRALILAHRDRLLQQAADKVNMVMPGVDLGLVKAERDEHDCDVVVASVQTLTRERRLQRIGRDFATVVVDEAHHARAESYVRILEGLGSFDKDGPLTLGVTATPERGDGLKLGSVFEELVYQCELFDLIKGGYLVDLRAVRVGLRLDLDQVAYRRGDYEDASLGAALTAAGAPEHAVEAWELHAGGRKTLVFTPTVALAYAMAQAFTNAGVTAMAIDGTTARDDRDDALERFRSGEVHVLCNCALLTEGYDEPSVECLIIARPTASRVLYMQMLGRATRKFPGKEDALIIDLVGASGRHELVTVADVFGLDPAGASGSIPSVLAAVAEHDQAATARGELVSEVVDLFAARQLHWSVGRRLHVLPAGDAGQVVLRQLDDGWQVLQVPRGGSLQVLASGLDLAYAQGVAEDRVRELGAARLAHRDAGWRALPATIGQLAMLADRGLDAAALTRGEASDLISIALAERVLQPASAKQRAYLVRLGIAVDDALTRAEASRLIEDALQR